MEDDRVSPIFLNCLFRCIVLCFGQSELMGLVQVLWLPRLGLSGERSLNMQIRMRIKGHGHIIH